MTGPILMSLTKGQAYPKRLRNTYLSPFYHRDSGTGLGLYLSKELCEANQAQLDYINMNGNGSVFQVTFAHHKQNGLRNSPWDVITPTEYRHDDKERIDH